MMEREVLERAVAIVAEHGDDAPSREVTSFDDEFAKPDPPMEWHRVAIAVDATMRVGGALTSKASACGRPLPCAG